MKLIIVGATGFVGTEILRQSLLRKDISSVVAITRRALTSPPSSPKLQNVVVNDYDQYSDEAKTAFKDANGCIWTIAITPSKSSNYFWEEVVRVCQTSTMVGLRTMHEAGMGKPFRFIYMSGIAGERDQTKTPSFKPKYSLMRGATESQVLAFSKEKGFEAMAAKPGLITDGGIAKRAFASVLYYTMSVPSIKVEQCAAAMLEQVVCGIEKEPLLNDDLVEVSMRMEKEGKMV
ncbi:uncharacterized protein CC84DRAFT_1167705 [Paraphaeosphaeria sporulosa]|uniref:NAD-dependent epimerase/dehydratase domain-containing protein n=1 Tax=Paraphaeosphaeria sporulosa TaxID=1460663 RepID=A0A177C225_9PLEO|nr:uncharacterized protein CC84DRAFT_1167705 [Paraphaeosphaeria sporulosa]OAG01495.1 hypothetical protein CC84DRAFT_1167705 [Paraphaeosphaeria sporulosa]